MQKCVFLLLFFIVFILFSLNIFNFNKIYNFSFAYKNSGNLEFERVYRINYENKNLTYYSKDFINEQNLSSIQKNIIYDRENLSKNINKLFKMGLSKKEICEYICPESKFIFNKISSIFNIYPQDDYINVISNKCKIEYVCGKSGKFIDQEKFYNDVLNGVLKAEKNINIKLDVEDFSYSQDSKNNYVEKGCFSTSFVTSSFERKNNIRVSLSKFDGIVLEEGETLSFNETTGRRDKEAGYMAAKIISNGTFVEGYGGGVCQVSTTLYNACLLSGLEILEVHNHSLPVSYIEPSFDAMVNSGTSDLVVRNNTSGKIVITTSYENDICKVKIYGKKNKYKITRISEKIKIIPSGAEIVDNDYLKYGNLNLEIGEEKRLSYAKEGFFSNGYLNYYDGKGNLIETKKIRENKYNATKGIVVKRES